MYKIYKFILTLVLVSLQFYLHSIAPDPLSVLLEKIDGSYELDKHAAYIVSDLGGGFFDDEINAIVPVKIEYIHEEWVRSKELIAQRIGQIHPPVSQETTLWKNSAESVDELLRDAQKVASYFRKSCKKIAEQTHSKWNFGPGNVHMIKSKESLECKVLSQSETMGIPVEDAIAQVGDVVRGTIIAESSQDIPKIAEEIQTTICASGGQAAFLNFWQYERDSGYIGIHAKILLPVPGKTGSKEKFILVELQIHLACIMDGTQECVKERSHSLYEQAKLGNLDVNEVSSALKLLYLTALRRCETCESSWCER
jgi:ppGpp synthetase/RelA/SpoT-type nucleotidyltranferase